MKRLALYIGLTAALVASCSTQEKDLQTHLQDDVVFYASFERPVDEGTRVYANEDLLLRWTADDRISIFNKNTYNQQYRFAGETGDNAGGFDKVAGSEFATGNAISHVVSVYPYQSTTKISESESLTLTLPAEQHYAENSFGLGANTMVSVTADNFLQYKTVGGYLRLRLYGESVLVSSITLKGNNGEKLAGKATVTMPLDGTPAVTLAEDATDQITLVCDTPVALGATVEEGKDFWLVVPPVSFSKGFTVTVSGKGGVFEKSTEKTVTIERNKLSKMAQIEVELSPAQPRNVIYYTSSDETVVTPRNDGNRFGANILSNEYVDGLGVITFDGDVTSIGGDAFGGCRSLTSITIPNSVTRIGHIAFCDCTSLTSITIPESVMSIGYSAFSGCFSLMSFGGKFASQDGLFLIDSENNLVAVALGAINGEVTIPDGVTRIGDDVFWGCRSLTSITIPEGVTSIGNASFSGCTSLTSITIPESVTSIENSAFTSCSSLPSITIPESVTSIGSFVFQSCRSLTSITIPEGVTSIGDYTFSYCTSLTSITIPEGVTSIGENAFLWCTSLNSITVKPEVPPTGSLAMFDETNNAPIYVPAGSVDAYKSAQYWSDYADRIQSIPSSSVPVPEAVDLGLPSGLKWASFNLGATKPEEYGDYYAWGETEPYYSSLDPLTWKEGKEAGYAWSSYKWCIGDYKNLTKYCYDFYYGFNGFTDTKTVLDLEDDAASVNLGSGWRMPTDAEWTELRNNCTWTWTTQNGIAGRRVTARNGNSIFLPAAGYRSGTNLYDAGYDGEYWSSTLYTDAPLSEETPPYAWTVVFVSGNVVRLNGSRQLGESIRPVTDLTIVNVKGVSLDLETISLRVGGTYTLTATVSPSSAINKSVIWKSYNAAVATVDSEGKVTAVGSGTTTIEVKTIDGGYSAACVVTVMVAGPITPAYVDMGNGLKWAKTNVGAYSEIDYGDYFAWGETKPHYESIASDGTVTWKSGYEDGYAWSNYEWYEGSDYTLTKYITQSDWGTVDNLTTLEAEDDAATVYCGGTWRTPTSKEWTWLRNNCTWTWTSDYKGSGVAGHIVTSNVEGYTSNSIFLPAAGYWSDCDLYKASTHVYYWSSSLDSGPKYAMDFVTSPGNVNVSSLDRCYGLSVRPVSE